VGDDYNSGIICFVPLQILQGLQRVCKTPNDFIKFMVTNGHGNQHATVDVLVKMLRDSIVSRRAWPPARPLGVMGSDWMPNVLF
jgi:hypothetical protein